jgi:hypothetical protein
MNAKEIASIKKIREAYEGREMTGVEKIRALDRECKRGPKIFSYVFGAVGALVLGAGMCLAMPEVISGFMPLGIAVGIIGIAMVSVNYPLYKKLVKAQRAKNREKILALADSLERGDEQGDSSES